MQVFRWCSAKRGVALGADGKANVTVYYSLLSTFFSYPLFPSQSRTLPRPPSLRGITCKTMNGSWCDFVRFTARL